MNRNLKFAFNAVWFAVWLAFFLLVSSGGCPFVFAEEIVFPPFPAAQSKVCVDLGGCDAHPNTQGAFIRHDYEYDFSGSEHASAYVTPNFFFGGQVARNSVFVNSSNPNGPPGATNSNGFSIDFRDQLRFIAPAGVPLPTRVNLFFIAHGWLSAVGADVFVDSRLTLRIGDSDNVNSLPIVFSHSVSAGGQAGVSNSLVINTPLIVSMPVVPYVTTSDGRSGGYTNSHFYIAGSVSIFPSTVYDPAIIFSGTGTGDGNSNFIDTLQLTSITLPEFGGRTPAEVGIIASFASGIGLPVPEPGALALAWVAAAICLMSGRSSTWQPARPRNHRRTTRAQV